MPSCYRRFCFPLRSKYSRSRVPSCCLSAARAASTMLCSFLLEDGFAFGDRDIAVNRQVFESLHEAARLRPLYFDPIDFGSLADSKHHARVVRREIAAGAHFEAMPH